MMAAQQCSAQNFKYMTREEFRSRVQVDNDESKWLHPRDHRGVNKVWQAIGEKHREYQLFGFIGGWRKKWFIICQCIDKDGVYQTERFQSATGDDAQIEYIWDREIRQWIFKHTEDTFAADRNNITPTLPQSLNSKEVKVQLGDNSSTAGVPTEPGPHVGKVRDADIARIAGELPQWQTVASNLGMGQLDIENIENNNRAPADQRKSFLIKWIWKNGNAATYEKLSEVLERLGEQGAAEKIRGIAQGK